MKIKVYYDGLCHLCATEISHYMKQAGSSNIEFIDITNSAFNPVEEGLDPVKVNKYMHVRNADGLLTTKVEAFRTIWQVLPKYKSVLIVSGLPVIRQILNFAYEFFAIIRPYLPKRKTSHCHDSPYCKN